MNKHYSRIASIVIAALFLLILSCDSYYYPATIIGYKPTTYKENVSHKFYYSIEQELKYANTVDVKSKTLWKGSTVYSLVSPDNRKIVFADGSDLYLIIADGAALKLPMVVQPELSYEERKVWKKPIGQVFYRKDSIQWAPDSKSFYIIKDEYYDSKFPDQYCSKKGRLAKYDIAAKKVTEIISQFPACDYFFGLNGRIYYTESTVTGDPMLSCWWNNRTYLVTAVKDNKTFSLLGYGDVIDKPFYSFQYPFIFAGARGVHMFRSGENGDVALFYVDADESHGPTLVLRSGQGLKGPTFGLRISCVHLPGDRYLLLGVNSSSFDGTLLIDRKTRKYKELPKYISIRRNINTNDNVPYNIDTSGIHAVEQHWMVMPAGR